MSDLNLFWRSVSLWFRLLMRVAVMAVILFGTLLLLRTTIDPGVCFHGMNRPITHPHIKYVVPFVLPLMAFWLSANAIFRTSNRQTATQFFGLEAMPFIGNAFIFGPLIGAHTIAVYGLPAYRVHVIAWVTAISIAPVLLWVLFEPGVFQAFAESDEKARKEERERQKRLGPNYELLMRILRRDYEAKIRDIRRMRINDDDRLYLEELADGNYRDRMIQIMSGGNQSSMASDSESIEALMQEDEER